MGACWYPRATDSMVKCTLLMRLPWVVRETITSPEVGMVRRENLLRSARGSIRSRVRKILATCLITYPIHMFSVPPPSMIPARRSRLTYPEHNSAKSGNRLIMNRHLRLDPHAPMGKDMGHVFDRC